MEYIGITMGDPAGIGAEVILKALQNKEYKNQSIVFGSVEVLKHFKKVLKFDGEINEIDDINEFKEDFLNVVNVLDVSMSDFILGKVSAVGGNAAYQYVEAAVAYANEGKLKAVVTGPLNKEALHLAGHKFDGHTEIFAHLTKTNKYAMLLWSEKLKTIHVSTHTSLRNACDKVKKGRVLDVIKLANDFLIKMGIKKPKIAVAGLNPHAGESGLFGDEEILEIIPAIQEAKKLGIDVVGPEAPDTVFLKNYEGKHDIVVAMYHDQGHIPMKLLAFDLGVNITVGLPILRTSVDHGTAFDIVGKGIANEQSLIEALKIAEQFNN